MFEVEDGMVLVVDQELVDLVDMEDLVAWPAIVD
jgi:hypothetical protein